MKNSKLYSLILIFALALLSIQCTTDPIEGPPGENGVDGIDGVDGVDGVNGTTECAICHNISTSEAVHASFVQSKHSGIPYDDGLGSWARGKSDRCSQCHNSQGFVDYLEFGIAGAYEVTTPLECSSCHDKHTTFDFENDGKDYALRQLAGVHLNLTDDAVTIDFEGTSNICTVCHQPRYSPQTAIYANEVDGFVNIETTRFGPHHGPQATMLEGIYGVEIEGELDYPAVADAGHRKNGACTNCHMGEPDGINGNHTWLRTTSVCTQCHQGVPPDEIGGLKDDMEALFAILEAEGILEARIDDEGHVSYRSIEGEYPTLLAEAAWNFKFVEEDQSNGVHNPKYARALIKNTLEALNNAD